MLYTDKKKQNARQCIAPHAELLDAEIEKNVTNGAIKINRPANAATAS
jgi:hypothetical protein